MKSFWRHVNKVLQGSEIIIEVLDARMIEETRNIEIENKIKMYGKKILYVINKCDLVAPERLSSLKNKLNPSVFISSKDKLGTTILKRKILELSHGEKVVVGVLGYPNVGKSSLINALSGRKAARTSSESGFTHGLQKINVDNKITVLDTPGVFPHQEKDEFKHSKTSAISYGKVKDPETAALSLIEEERETIVDYYQIKEEKLVRDRKLSSEKILELVAFKLGKLLKAGKPDLEAASRLLLKDWQVGKIRKK